MNQDVDKLVGICGLYCGACQNYLAYREKDTEQLEKISREKELPVEDIRCDGCLSEHVFPSCVVCRHGFRECALEKGVTWCFQCHDFPCRKLRDFTDVHVVNGISHHAMVIEDLQYMRDHGIKQWVAKQQRAARCPQCGKTLYWFIRECPECHTQIR